MVDVHNGELCSLEWRWGSCTHGGVSPGCTVKLKKQAKCKRELRVCSLSYKERRVGKYPVSAYFIKHWTDKPENNESD